MISNKYISNLQIQHMSFPELKKKVVSGEITEKRLRDYYTQARRTATQRARRTSAPEVVSQFGNDEKEYFLKLKSITTLNSLVHEIADVNRFLNSERSTITGLKNRRSRTIEQANKLGFDLDEKNYLDFIKFMQWFKSSEYSKLYDSDSEEVCTVFNNARASSENWKRAFGAFQNIEKRKVPSRKY